MDASAYGLALTTVCSLGYRLIERRLVANDEHEFDPAKRPLLAETRENGTFEKAESKEASLADGKPLHLERFWQRTQAAKLFLVLLIASLFLLGLFRLTFDVIINDQQAPKRARILLFSSEAIHVAFRCYALILTVEYARLRSVIPHWNATVHLFTILTINAIGLALSLVPPSIFRLPGAQEVTSLASVRKAEAIIAVLAMLAVGFTPHAPRYHYKPPAVQESEKEEAIENVTLYTNASILSILFFSWANGIISEGNKKTQMSFGDLPFLPADIRGKQVFQKWSATGRRMNLLLRILYVNRARFAQQSLLAFLSAILYYAPAFFLQQLIAYLEQGKTEAPTLMGYLYCLGLFASLFLDAVLGGIMWFTSNALICATARMQLNTMIYSKTLRRKDLSINKKASDEESSPQVDQHVTPGLPLPNSMNGSATKQPDAKVSNAKVPEDNESNDDDDEEKQAAFTSKTQVLNLFSVDVDRIADFSQYSFTIIDAPIEMVIGTLFLYKLLGTAGLFGILLSAVFLPFNHYASKKVAKVQDKLMTARDKRTSAINEVLSSIRMIKYCAWEKPFEERLQKARENELHELRRNFVYEVILEGVWELSPVGCVIAAFFIYTVLQGNTLTPSIAFASLAVFNELRFALNAIPELVVEALQAFVSLRRIDRYINLPDIAEPFPQSAASRHEPQPVVLRNATITWPSTQEILPSESRPISGVNTPHRGRLFALHNVDCDFEIGGLNLVTGPLGSGKTLLLLGLLGEADLLAGQVICPRSQTDAIDPHADQKFLTDDNWILHNQLGYVPQTAWLQNATIQQNILFGLPLRQERYDKVLHVCALNPDMQILEDGDQTEIGANGVTLSGGQKHRVSLARAIYSRAGVLLFDDVLSAVDSHTADHIYKKCLKGELVEGRTIILVSHHTQLVAPGAARVLLLGNGEVRFSGSRADFEKSEYAQTYMGGSDEPETPAVVENRTLKRLQAAKEAPTSDSSDLSSSEDEAESDSDESINDKAKSAPRKLVADEERAIGSVSRSVWMSYLKANSLVYWIFFLAVFVSGQIGRIGEAGWLSVWSGKGEAASENVGFYVGVYAAISLGTVCLAVFQNLVLYAGSIKASRVLHQSMLSAVLRAPLRYFDTTAQGTLANRFAKDLEGADSELPEHYSRVTELALSLITTIISITAVAPPFIVALCLLAVLYWYYGRQYSHVAREMRRLDSVSKSPLFSLYGETVSGAAVIRAFGASSWFFSSMLDLVDKNMTFYFHLWTVKYISWFSRKEAHHFSRWLSARFQVISALGVGITGVLLLRGAGSASIAGFALTFTLHVSNDVLFLVRRYTQLELAMVAVERIKQMSDIKPEAPSVLSKRPPASWPTSGKLEIDNLCVRYAPELPDVLHEVDFVVQGGEKIGIVGATGCGKSTLAMSFFRFVEAHSGRILLDGIDIASIGLYDLRSHLSIIPQDPTILSGTLRSSLDVFSEHSDQDILDALKRVYLIPADDAAHDSNLMNENVFLDLDSEVAEQGSNFSQGQRQLICLCRAILARSKVVVCDEATSSVDYQTDELISQTIEKEFKDVTLLVIAHRLRTIITFDKVLVLDAGRIVEYDSPAKLLSNTDSRFYSLCQSSGKHEFRILKKMADGRLSKKAALQRPPPKLRRKSTAMKK